MSNREPNESFADVLADLAPKSLQVSSAEVIYESGRQAGMARARKDRNRFLRAWQIGAVCLALVAGTSI